MVLTDEQAQAIIADEEANPRKYDCQMEATICVPPFGQCGGGPNDAEYVVRYTIADMAEWQCGAYEAFWRDVPLVDEEELGDGSWNYLWGVRRCIDDGPGTIAAAARLIDQRILMLMPANDTDWIRMEQEYIDYLVGEGEG